MKRAILLLMAVTMFGGLLNAGESETEEVTAEKACFRVRDVRSFKAVTDRFVYLRGVRNQHFLLTMDNMCVGLENSVGIAMANGFDRVCSNDRAMITYKDFNQPKRCGILTIEAVDDRDAALELIKERMASNSPSENAGTSENNAASEEPGRRR